MNTEKPALDTLNYIIKTEKTIQNSLNTIFSIVVIINNNEHLEKMWNS